MANFLEKILKTGWQKTQFSMQRHNNPDGSLGGYVSQGASVHPSATIESGAIVHGGVVGPNAVIKNGFIVDPDGNVVEIAKMQLAR